MVSTRSAGAGTKRTVSQAFQPAKAANASSGVAGKKKEAAIAAAAPPPPASTSPAKKARKTKTKSEPSEPDVELPLLSEEEIARCTTIAMPSLPFDLAHGKEHLVAADVRFKRLVERIPLKVFEEISGEGGKELNLFRTLVTSILGQQVSWLAARAILYKFTRLWFPELPEKADFKTLPRDALPFPTPLQVRSASESTLRSAGLSGQKVRYVSDIACRFSDGRLDVRSLVAMRDEEDVVRTLVAIKGVGVWTAQMLLIFALRRPDVLPVGDLGVQKGMVLLWASGGDGPAIKSAKALPEEEEKVMQAVQEGEAPIDGGEGGEDLAALPTLDEHSQEPSKIPTVPALPASSGLTSAQLNARKNGTKTKGNVYLSAAEMESLAETWRPYRSLASVYMWALVDA